jgi:predicted RNase H-like nuclease (RuvC/YqgF family)
VAAEGTALALLGIGKERAMDADSNRKFEEIRLEIDRLNERLKETERSVAELFSQLARIRDRLGFDTEVEAT